MASSPPFPIDDMPMPADAPASEIETVSSSDDQPTISPPEAVPEPTPETSSAEPVINAGDPAGPEPAAASGVEPAPAAPFGPKSVRGGNMFMRVLSRAMQDLEVATGGTRAATYDEVDEYVGRAIKTEQSLERAALAEQAASGPRSSSEIAQGDARARPGDGIDREATMPEIKPAILFRMTGGDADNGHSDNDIR
jgi:hypothetical protein